MAERKRQRQVCCQNQYVYDRLASQKISQVYHWLVPDPPERSKSDRKHLRDWSYQVNLIARDKREH